MMRRCPLVAPILLMIAIVTGCADNAADSAPAVSNQAGASPIDLSTAQPEQAAPEDSVPNQGSNGTEYTLDGSVYEEDGDYYLKVESNLFNTSGDWKMETGHAHYYLNDRLMSPITNNTPYKLMFLQEGKNTIRLVLADIYHAEIYGVSKELTVAYSKAR